MRKGPWRSLRSKAPCLAARACRHGGHVPVCSNFGGILRVPQSVCTGWEPIMPMQVSEIPIFCCNRRPLTRHIPAEGRRKVDKASVCGRQRWRFLAALLLLAGNIHLSCERIQESVLALFHCRQIGKRSSPWRPRLHDTQLCHVM